MFKSIIFLVLAALALPTAAAAMPASRVADAAAPPASYGCPSVEHEGIDPSFTLPDVKRRPHRRPHDGHRPMPIPEQPGRMREDGSPATSCGTEEFLLSRLTPEFIAVYENRVARDDIVSGMSESELSLLSEKLGVSAQKAKALILLGDLVARTFKPVPLSALASMSTGELIALSRCAVKAYSDALPEAERDDLKKEFFSAMKK